MNNQDYISSKDAVKLCDYTLLEIRELCKQGMIPSEKEEDWKINKKDFLNWLKTKYPNDQEIEEYIEKVKQLANADPTKYYCILKKNNNFIICEEEETIIKGKDEWKVIYGCQCNICGDDKTLITVSPTAYDLIIEKGWFGENKTNNTEPKKTKGRRKKEFRIIFEGWLLRNVWYHPNNPPKFFVDRINQVFMEHLRKKGYRFINEQ
ncbi:MAG TPA: hypothetical protein PKA10_13965 [Selenomonadales bacterium]|nr:hypothetical protein [Selenomonadales bacterium]